MKLTAELLHETALFIKDFYTSEFSHDFSFHNYNRAATIVNTCMTLGVQMNLGKEELKTLQLAAWFLETGYCRDYGNYQNASVLIACNYLDKRGIDDETRNIIEEAILSTRIPQQPATLVSQVLCDASMHHLAEKKSLHFLENLRMEQKTICGNEYSFKEWMDEYLSMVNSHSYFTSAGKELFEKRKQKYIAWLQQQCNELQSNGEPVSDQPSAEKSDKVIDAVIEDIKLERGVETFFRITERRHIELSSKAHEKASLLISVNSIVISIVLSVLITKLEENKFLLLPTLLLVITCVSVIILSIISTRPRFIGKNGKDSRLKYEEFNLLFFGDFSKLSLTDYKKAMKETYKNKNELYDSLSRDIYYQGIILAWKYKRIKIAYDVFMYGFVVTILSFIIAFMIKTS